MQRKSSSVEILVATKYVPLDQLPKLVEAGVTLGGENQAQALIEKSTSAAGKQLTWDFIGQLQSRKVKQILPYARLIHSVCSESVLKELGHHGNPDTEILIQVNISGESTKAGIKPEQLDDFIGRCPVRVIGLMTMPPATDNPERSRPYFAALRELAAERGLAQLSMGTSQDYKIAVEEGATIIRLGQALFTDPSSHDNAK